MKVYVVTFDDGDYYCEGGHIVGVFTNKEEAEGIAEKVKKNGIRITPSYVTHVYETAIGEYELGEIDGEIP